MCPKHVEKHNYRNKILCIKLESEVNYIRCGKEPPSNSVRRMSGVTTIRVTKIKLCCLIPENQLISVLKDITRHNLRRLIHGINVIC